MNDLVSIIIPTKNSSEFLENCLRSVRQQTHKQIEVIIVDGKSIDIHIVYKLADKYNCKIFSYLPRVKKGLFDATKKRNFGAIKAKGMYIYHLDADMELTKYVVEEAIGLCNKGFDAVIIPEDSFGEGIWSSAKNLERRFFWGDDTVESPRFFKKRVWDLVKGYDENIAGGGDDRDIYQKLLETGYKVGRIKSLALNNEGTLHLTQLFKKQFMYKREALKYIRKRPLVGIKSYIPLRKSHFTNWRMFVSRPKDTLLFIIMKTTESIGGICGTLYSLFER